MVCSESSRNQSDLANNTLKDPYIFDFLSIGETAHEREIEKGLVDHIQKFLLELGAGLAYVGRQVHLEVGQEDFYLSAVDAQVKTSEDNPTIGILLCKTKNEVIAEYALKDISKPMGISEYRIGDAIPEKIKTALPSIEELEQELARNSLR